MAFRQIKSPALANQAVIETKLAPASVSGQTAAASVASLDTFLLHSAATSSLAKVTAADLIGSYSTDDLAEGSNLYFTDARAQSAVAQDIADAVAAEATIRSAADTQLTNDLAAEVTRATAAEGVNATAIANEITRAQTEEASIRTDFAAADTVLQNQINNIISNVDPAALDSLSEIVAEFQSADSAISAAVSQNATAISNEVTRATAAEGVLTANLAQEVLDRQAGDATLTTALNQEVADRTAGDNALDVRVTANEGDIATLQTDLVAEIAATNLDVTALQAADTQEAADRLAADQALAADIQAEITRASNAEGVNATAIAAETTRAQTEEASIRTDFAAADSALDTSLKAYADQAEADAKTYADGIVSTEETARIAGDNALDGRVTTLEGEMDDAESRLDDLEALSGTSGSLDTVATNVIDAINEVHGEADALDVRVTANEADIATNAADIASILSNTDPAALDSLAEIVTAFQAADTVHTAAINAAIADRALIRTEFANADAAITSALNAEIAATDGEVTQLQNDLASETSNRIAGDAATLASAQAYADQAEADAIATAAADATTKANAAKADAIAHADAQDAALIGDNTVDGTAGNTVTDRITDGDAATLVSANAYTDGKDAAVRTDFAAADTALQLQITANDGDIATNAADISTNAADLAQEVLDRAAGDTALQNALNAEIAATNTDITNLTNDLAAEVTRATNAEGANATAIANEVTRATNKDNAHDSAIAQNVTNIAQNAADITTEQGARIAADNALDVRVTANEGDIAQLQTDVAANASALATEIAATDGEVTALQNRVTATETDIAFIQSNTDPAALDSLTEIVTAFQAADGNLNTAITNLASTASTDRAAIRTEFAAADSALDTSLKAYADTAEADAIASAAAYTDAEVLAEENARIAADNALDARLTTEEGNVDALEATMGTATLSTTAQTVTAAINELNSGSAASVAALQSEVDTVEAALGLNADGSYAGHSGTNYIDAATTAKGAIELLDGALKTEETARIAGDAATLASAQAYADTAEADAITTSNAYTDAREVAITTAYTAAIGVETNRATGVEGQLQADLTAEVNRATLAEGALQTALNTEASTARAAEGANATAIANAQAELDVTQSGAGLATDGTYSANGSADYISGATSLADADNKLDAAIKAMDVAYKAADTVLTNDLASEEAARIAADTLLTTNLNNEIARAQNAEGVNAAAISQNASDIASEEARAQAAEGVLTTDLAALTATVNDVISNTDPAALDSLTEIVTAFQNADSNLTTLVTQNATDIAAEETRALAAEGVLSTAIAAVAADLTTENGRATAEEASIRSDFAAADAAQDVVIATKLPLAGGTMTGNIAMSGGMVTGLGTATQAGDAVSKAVLDAAIAAQDISVYNTDDLGEGSTNLYFTEARARTSISVNDVAGAGLVSYDSSTGVISVDTNESVLDLTDVSDTAYTGKENYVLAVNATEDGMELKNPLEIFVTNQRQTIDGDGVSTTYALTITATQSHAFVFVGGVIQDPSTHYSIDDVAGTITMNSTVPTGTQIVIISPDAGTAPVLVDGQVTSNKLAADIKAFTQKTAVSAGTGGAVVDSFAGGSYRSAKYVIQVDNGAGEYETREALVVHDGSNAYITEYALVYTGSNLIGDASVQMNGTSVELVYTANSGTATVKVIATYIDA